MGAGNVLAGVLISACLAVFVTIAIHVTGAVSAPNPALPAPISGPLAGGGPYQGLIRPVLPARRQAKSQA